MIFRKILVALLCLTIWLLLVETKFIKFNKCYNPSTDFYPYLASRTPYKFIHGEIERPKGCRPLQIWMTARHGTRYPDRITKQQMLDLEDFRDQIVANHNNGRGQLCPKDLKNLRLWQKDPNFYEGEYGSLSDEGKNELRLLAKRLKGVFPDILQSNKPTDYQFAATNNERATSSLLSFANLLLGTNETLEYEDGGFKSARSCPRWQKEYLHQKQMIEPMKFRSGPHMQQSLNEISHRLGFNETVRFDIVNVMYEVCRYETALNAGNISVWCTVLSKEDLKVFEYLSDLDYYYCCGPGNVLSKELNCGILQKLFETFSMLENGNTTNQPKGIFNFGHSTNIQSVMTLLKVFEPEGPLLASNYKKFESRLFSTTFIDAFSSNIVAVFYRCENMTFPNQVQFNIAENPMHIPGCKGNMCDWEYLKREFQPIINECDANFCDLQQKDISNSATNSLATNVYGSYFILVIFIIFDYYTCIRVQL